MTSILLVLAAFAASCLWTCNAIVEHFRDRRRFRREEAETRRAAMVARMRAY